MTGILNAFWFLMNVNFLTWFKIKAAVIEEPMVDTAKYLVSSKRRTWLLGAGRTTNYPVVKFEGNFTIEIEELMQDRFKDEPCFLIGTREELMAKLPFLSNQHFDNCKTMDYYRVTKIKSFVDNYLTAMPNAQHAFRHWLQTQVKEGKIIEIDGFRFKDVEVITPRSETTGEWAGHHKHLSIGSHDKNVLAKNCEVSDFLYRYYDSYQKAVKLKLVPNLKDNINEFSKELMRKILLDSMGIRQEQIFIPVMELIRNDDQSVAKLYQSKVVDKL
jgi:hypothetical protein